MRRVRELGLRCTPTWRMTYLMASSSMGWFGSPVHQSLTIDPCKTQLAAVLCVIPLALIPRRRRQLSFKGTSGRPREEDAVTVQRYTGTVRADRQGPIGRPYRPRPGPALPVLPHPQRVHHRLRRERQEKHGDVVRGARDVEQRDAGPQRRQPGTYDNSLCQLNWRLFDPEPILLIWSHQMLMSLSQLKQQRLKAPAASTSRAIRPAAAATFGLSSSSSTTSRVQSWGRPVCVYGIGHTPTHRAWQILIARYVIQRILKPGPGRYCLTRHRMPFNSIHKETVRWMTSRAISARPYPPRAAPRSGTTFDYAPQRRGRVGPVRTRTPIASRRTWRPAPPPSCSGTS